MQPIELEIPMRTPTTNKLVRTHWAKRGRIGRQVAKELWIAMVLARIPRPEKPIRRFRIEIMRESTKEPDRDGLFGSAKFILDALQPPSRRHPYGIGLIADDSPAHMLDLDVRHVHGKGERTRIRIEPVEAQ